jgi:hypothetical protein
MNSHPIAADSRAPDQPRRGAALTFALLLGLVAAGAGGCSGGLSEAQAVQDALMDGLPGEWQTRIQVSVGPALFGLARAGVALADVEPEARTAIRSVRGCQVSIHQFVGDRADRPAMLAGTDRAMSEHGWERVVGVLDGDELVAVYAPSGELATRRLPLCVMVFDGRELVVVSALGNVEPLAELAFAELRRAQGQTGKRRWLGDAGFKAALRAGR